MDWRVLSWKEVSGHFWRGHRNTPEKWYLRKRSSEETVWRCKNMNTILGRRNSVDTGKTETLTQTLSLALGASLGSLVVMEAPAVWMGRRRGLCWWVHLDARIIQRGLRAVEEKILWEQKGDEGPGDTGMRRETDWRKQADLEFRDDRLPKHRTQQRKYLVKKMFNFIFKQIVRSDFSKQKHLKKRKLSISDFFFPPTWC